MSATMQVSSAASLTRGFQDVTFEDRDTIRGFVDRYGMQSCMFNFVHIYTRTDRFHFRYMVIDDRLFLVNGHFGKLYYPAGRPIEPRRLAAVARDLGFTTLHFVPEPFVLENPSVIDDFEITSASGEREYIYSTEALASMAGGALSRKRESINRFVREYPDHHFRRVGAGDAATCVQLAREWMDRKETDPRIEWEFDSLAQSLDRFDDLGLDGLGLFVNGRLVAYDIFSGGVGDLASCSFEKFDRSIRDCIPPLRREIGRYLSSQGWAWMNFGRDIDVPGLAASKRSWAPARMLNHCTLTLRVP